ncbi:hypothetical protein [Prescottella agglutinans]|uniref:Uncharacterized protein n=1 Tax=Prescottella agglutinans TaxID=1644129 RepID=A0ABT6MI28_9NOCA|nr:hypothetical protein [Prescottella agglutinans]MDH6283978.1 hypothetical protein [Prescottella agglutinans]
MPTSLTDTELAIVDAVLAIEPALTSLRIGAERDSRGAYVWHDTVVFTAGRFDPPDAIEIDPTLVAHFAADHPADGREHVIEVTAMVRAAVVVRYAQQLTRRSTRAIA